MSLNIHLSSLLILVLALSACSPQPEQPDANEFEAFYKKFHENPSYQLSHITFPLEGLPSDADAETIASGDFHWNADDWQVHRPFNFENSEFTRELLSFGNDLVIEKIIHKSGEYGTIRRFAKLGNDWFLIYYAGMNRIE